jgi:hypothetical protein
MMFIYGVVGSMLLKHWPEKFSYGGPYVLCIVVLEYATLLLIVIYANWSFVLIAMPLTLSNFMP